MRRSGEQSWCSNSENAARVAPEKRRIPTCLPRSFHIRDATREVAVDKRKGKTPRTPIERRGAENWFPGSGSQSEVPLGFSRKQALPASAPFSAYPSGEIRAEIERQEKKLQEFEMEFPRALTCTLGELSPVEEQVAKEMEAHQATLELLKLELTSRSESPATPGLIPKKDSIPKEDEEFKHSDDFRSIRWQGISYSLTPGQAQIVQILHEGCMAGTPELPNAYILEKLEATTSRLRDSFKRTDLWGDGKLIIPCKRRGMYRLNLPDPAR
jgi:hypothetical protein